MVVYSIKDIEKLTGVKAHTIRIWEKRYAIVMPKRTKTNIRYYDEEDLKSIMNIALLNSNGYKISNIAKLSMDERVGIAAKLNNVDSKFENNIDAITYSVLNLDEHNINLILNSHIDQAGLKQTMEDLINPLLEKMGMMWLAGSISEVHEKFLTNLLRNMMIGQINTCQDHSNKTNKTKVLLYLPEGQSHELSLLYLHFMLKSQGFEVLMFGSNLSLEAISKVVQMKKVDKVVTILNDKLKWSSTAEYISELSQAIGPDIYAIITGYEVFANLKNPPSNIYVVQSVSELLTFEVSQKVKVGIK
jgi:DNA-binding transcriptional MerR regulator